MSIAPAIAAADLHDLRWLLSMPVSRAMLTAAGAICMRHLMRVHGPALRPADPRKAHRLAGLAEQFERRLAALDDVARAQADGIALPDRERWATGRAEAARLQLAEALDLLDTRAFHGAQEDAHGFPFYPAPPVLLTRRRRRPPGGNNGGTPLAPAGPARPRAEPGASPIAFSTTQKEQSP